MHRALLALVIAISACQGGDSAQETLTVFNAGSLARPLKAALDTFARRENVRVHQESAGSLESARKLTELGKVPDLIALADAAVFPQYLVPRYVTSYTLFARNRMVVAFTDRSRHAREIGTANWPEILTRADVDVGRSDPDLDPNGYRTLMVWQLIARTRGDDALAARLEAQAVPRNVRAKEADLVGLLQAGELDYIWSYESMAKATGLRWVMLGDSVDLSQPALADFYGQARVALRGAREGEHVVFTGQPIVYALAVPAEAPNRALGERFEAFLLGAEGRAILRREGLDVLEMPQVEHGTASAGLLAGRAARR